MNHCNLTFARPYFVINTHPTNNYPAPNFHHFGLRIGILSPLGRMGARLNSFFVIFPLFSSWFLNSALLSPSPS
jgi:hypothetical protein